MAADSETKRTLQAAVENLSYTAKAQKKIDPLVKDLSAKVPAAVKEGEKKKLQFYLKALRVALNAISSALFGARQGFDCLESVQKDEDFLEHHLKEVEKVMELLTAAQKVLTQQYAAIKDLENQAEQALKSRKESKNDFLEKITELDGAVTWEVAFLQRIAQKVNDCEGKAREALDKRDAKALASAQKAVQEWDVCNLVKGFGVRETRLTDLLKKIRERGFDAKDNADLLDAVNDLIRIHSKGATTLTNLQDAEKRILALRLANIDVKGALRVLELDPGCEPKLAKILKGAPNLIERQLDALAKELKLKTNGKTMLAKLKAEKML